MKSAPRRVVAQGVLEVLEAGGEEDMDVAEVARDMENVSCMSIHSSQRCFDSIQ